MTDRIHSITIVLEEDTRVDDAESLLNAVKMMKGVVSAEGNVADCVSYVAETRVRSEIGRKLFKVLHPPKDGE